MAAVAAVAARLRRHLPFFDDVPRSTSAIRYAPVYPVEARYGQHHPDWREVGQWRPVFASRRSGWAWWILLWGGSKTARGTSPSQLTQSWADIRRRRLIRPYELEHSLPNLFIKSHKGLPYGCTPTPSPFGGAYRVGWASAMLRRPRERGAFRGGRMACGHPMQVCLPLVVVNIHKGTAPLWQTHSRGSRSVFRVGQARDGGGQFTYSA